MENTGYEVRRSGSIRRVMVNNQLWVENCGNLLRTVQELLSSPRIRNVYVDFSQCTNIDTLGYDVLAEIAELTSQYCPIRFVNLDKDLHTGLLTRRLPKVLALVIDEV